MSSGTVGIVTVADDHLRDGPGPWARRVIRSLVSALTAPARPRFYDVAADPARSFTQLAGALAGAEADGVAALVVVDPNANPVWDEIIAAFSRTAAVPVVYVAAAESALPATIVHHDQRRTGGDAAGHLLERGYPRLLALQPYHEPWLAQRVAGMRAAAVAARLDPARLRIDRPARNRRFAGWQALPAPEQRQELRLRLTQALDEAGHDGSAGLGVLAANDAMALEVASILPSLGLRIGADIGLVGFDDSDAASAAGLTSLAPPLMEMGQAAARLLLDAFAGRAVASMTRLPSRLHGRSSTRRD